MKSLFIVLSALSMSALAHADGQMCGVLEKLAKKEYAAKVSAAKKSFDENDLQGILLGGNLVIARLSEEDKVLLAAARQGKLSTDRLARALEESVLEPVREDLSTIGVAPWDATRHLMRFDNDHGKSVLKVCYREARAAYYCAKVDLVSSVDPKADFLKSVQSLAHFPSESESDYVKRMIPAECKANGMSVAVSKVDETPGAPLKNQRPPLTGCTELPLDLNVIKQQSLD